MRNLPLRIVDFGREPAKGVNAITFRSVENGLYQWEGSSTMNIWQTRVNGYRAPTNRSIIWRTCSPNDPMRFYRVRVAQSGRDTIAEKIKTRFRLVSPP